MWLRGDSGENGRIEEMREISRRGWCKGEEGNEGYEEEGKDREGRKGGGLLMGD